MPTPSEIETIRDHRQSMKNILNTVDGMKTTKNKHRLIKEISLCDEWISKYTHSYSNEYYFGDTLVVGNYPIVK